ncbi:MAG: hypothetical protein SFW67_18995 [Myxococcaceae bacterium]|nr:hypothetical protein [Myxococcaceae bacterium]
MVALVILVVGAVGYGLGLSNTSKSVDAAPADQAAALLRQGAAESRRNLVVALGCNGLPFLVGAAMVLLRRARWGLALASLALAGNVAMGLTVARPLPPEERPPSELTRIVEQLQAKQEGDAVRQQAEPASPGRVVLEREGLPAGLAAYVEARGGAVKKCYAQLARTSRPCRDVPSCDSTSQPKGAPRSSRSSRTRPGATRSPPACGR